MKKFLALLFFCNSTLAFTQSIPNGGFESWNMNTYKTLLHYPYSSNYEKVNVSGYPNVSQTTDAYSNSYAIKLQTIGSGTNISFGFVANGTPFGTFLGGVPCVQKPNGIRFRYKANIMLGDTAYVLISFKKNSVAIGQYTYKISSSVSTYSLFNVNFLPALPQNPDTVIVGMLSSMPSGNFNGIPGNMLQVDSLLLKGITQPPLLNGDFEHWQNQTFYNPTGWKNSLGVLKTNDIYSGTSAIELQTIPVGGFNSNPQAGRVTTGFDFQTSRMGYPYTNTTDTLIFFYKYIPAHPTDTARVNAVIKKNGLLIAGPTRALSFNASYTEVKFPLNTGIAPDSLIVSFSSSKVPSQAVFGGSDLKIDNLYLKSQMIPQSNFTTPISACVGVPLQLTDLSFNMPNSWAWITPGGTPGSSNVQNPIITYNLPGTKTITMVSSNQFGSGIPITKTITVFPNPNVMVTSTTTPCGGSGVNLTATGATTYSWDTGQTTPVISVSVNVTSTLIVTGSSNGCSATATASVFVPSPVTPQICMVTVDSLGLNNEIYWDKNIYSRADSFIVYRETPTFTNVAYGAYTRIGAVSRLALSVITDTARSKGGLVNGDPRFTSYKYKLQIFDSCGVYSALSPFHQTLFIQDQLNGNFNWNSYTVEGAPSPVSAYVLWRKNLTTGATFSVGGTSANLISDPYYNLFYPTNVKWFVDAVGFNCDATLKVMALKTRTKSNQTNERSFPQTINENELLLKNVAVYPNPASNYVNIDLGVTSINYNQLSYQYVITNSLGQELQNSTIKNQKQNIDLSNLNSGIYFITVKHYNKNITTKKLIIE